MQLVHEPNDTMLGRVGRRAAMVIALVAFAAGCTAPAGGGTTNPPATGAPTTGGTALTLEVGSDATLGAHVTGKDGLALYVFKQDSGAASSCNDQCAASWPPLIVTNAADVQAGSGVTGELGTITRADGTTQVTLDGKPLYYFSGDKAAGDVNGQGLNDVWYLVSPAGEAVGDEHEGDGDGPSQTPCGGRYCY